MAASFAAARTWFVVVTLTAVGAAAAAGYALTAPKRYRATAQILVTPVSGNDPTFAGLDVLRDSSGRRTAAESTAVLVRSPQVADAVRASLGVRQSSTALLHALHTGVEYGSNVVDVSVEDASASSSAQLANAFVDALIAQRTASFQSQLSSAIRRDAQLLADGSAGPQSVELARRLAVLRSFQGQPDPTLRRAATAVAPTSASWPDVPRLIAIGAGIGLAAAALGMLAFLLLRRPNYDRAMPGGPRSDRAVEALVDRLEQRLHAREAALAARERDLQAKIEELQMLDGGGRLQALAERERQLEERVALVTRRELEVARRAAAPQADEGREPELAERERALDERERLLEERVAAVTERELAVARRAATAPPPLPPPEPAGPAPVADAPAPPPAPPEANGSFNLAQLEQIVEARGPRYPDRLEEWRSYLFFLRDYAEPDGTLPGSFDWLVQDTFRELLQ